MQHSNTRLRHELSVIYILINTNINRLLSVNNSQIILQYLTISSCLTCIKQHHDHSV